MNSQSIGQCAINVRSFMKFSQDDLTAENLWQSLKRGYDTQY